MIPNNKRKGNSRSKEGLSRAEAKKQVAAKGPPQIPTNVCVTRTYRFRATAGGEYLIVQGDLMSVGGGMTTAINSSCTLLAGAYKIHSVKMWGPVLASGPTTVGIEWFSAFGNLRCKQVSDTTVSTAFPAYVESSPPSGSNAEFISGAGSANVLSLLCPLDAVIDIHMSHYLQDNMAISTKGVTTAPTLGQMFWFALDSGNYLVPVALSTTT
jgi:hypothetical protein